MVTEMRWKNRLSGRSRAKFADPDRTEKNWPTHWWDPGSRPRSAGNHSDSPKWRISPPCERLPSPPHSQDLHGKINVRVSRGADNCHIPRRWPAAFKWNHRETIWSLAVLTYQANWLLGTGTPAATKARATRSFSVWCLDDLPARGLFADKVVQTTSVERRATSAKMGDTQVQPKS